MRKPARSRSFEQYRRLPLSLLCVLAALAGCAGAPAAATVPVEWRVASYNMHAGRGMDGATDLERIARVLAALDADVIALQEVDDSVQRSGRVDQARRLGELLGMEHAFGRFMDYQGGRYGLAILSRHPIRRTEVVPLPEGNEPRVALAVRVERAAATPVTFVALHFDWVGNDTLRYAQAQALARWLDGLEGPYVLAGDFNDVPGSRTLQLFQSRALEAAKPAADRFTFSSTDPQKEIDFIFAWPRSTWSAREVRVIDERMASDHRPVFAVLVHRVAR